MCGRFTLFSSPADLAAHFDVDEVRGPPLVRRYNIAPTDPVHTIAQHDGRRVLDTLRWGLLAPWARAGARGAINARAESIADRPSFRADFLARRCIIPADAFYEWRTIDGRKQPYLIRLASAAPMAFAGVYSSADVATCAIVTTSAHATMSHLHDRMPVVLDRRDWGPWLDPGVRDVGALSGLLIPQLPEELVIHPVAPLVNDVRNDDERLIAPIAAA